MSNNLLKIAFIPCIFAVAASASARENSSSGLSSRSLEDIASSPENLVGENLWDSSVDVWSKYKSEQLKDTVRMQEFQNKAINYNGLTMKFAYSKVGNQPSQGFPLYIALHGGGGAPAYVNDSQWEDMKRYYLANVKEGIYLAPRGATNTWNLHFVDESYVMYDRLIEDMILFENVDPNRVYILGFSAGGDGVWGVAPRMPDRFAAANMSAGHPNGISMTNLYNLPFQIQVGEFDSAYNRNRVDAEYCVNLAALHAANPAGYINNCNVHFGKPHNFYDNHPSEAPQTVIANPEKWLKSNDRSTVNRNTSAIAWLKQFTRNPLPNKIIWDLDTRANRSGVDGSGRSLWLTSSHGQQNYWLDIGTNTATSLGTHEIIARLDRSSNAVIFDKSAPWVRILLKQEMLDLGRPIQVQVDGQTLMVNVGSNSKTMARTVLDRGDVNYIFESAILLEKVNGNWKVSQVD